MSHQSNTPENTELVLNEEVVAAAALTSEQSWEILTQLYLECSKKMMATQGFVGPVANQLPVLRDKLNDGIGFEKSFNTLLSDIRTYGESLNRVYQQHAGRTGVPTEADWPTVFGASQQYSDLINHFDGVIAPLIFSLVEIIRREHGDMLDMSTGVGGV